MKKALLILVIATNFLFSCKKEQDDVIVPNVFKGIFQEFCIQASSRNVNIKFRYLKEVVLQGAISQYQCSTFNGNPAAAYYDYYTHKIYVDTTNNDFLYYKEALLYHELGHALLRREHRNTLFADNNTPVSIMHQSIMASLNKITNQYYLDELFFQDKTPYPIWVASWK